MPAVYITAFSFVAAAVSVLLAFTLGAASGNGWAVLPLCALSLVLLAVSAYWVIGRALRPMVRLNEAIERMEAGDLIDTETISSDGPFGALAGRLGMLAGYIDESAGSGGALADTVPDPLIDIDRSGNVVCFNDAATRLTGHEREDVIGRPFIDLVDRRSANVAKAAYERVMAGEPAGNVEIALTLKDGGARLFEFNAAPVFRDGAVEVCRAVGRDIDERSGIMEELKKARAEAEESSAKLRQTVRDLEDFALLAVRREIKMQEIREMLQELRKDRGMKRISGQVAGSGLAQDIYRP